MIETRTLQSLALPEEPDLRRDHVTEPAFRGEGYDTRYDFHTLIYDAVADPDGRAVWLYCPRLLNFEPILRDLRLDGAPIVIKQNQVFERHQVVEVQATGSETGISLEIGGWRGQTGISPLETDLFAGRNVLLTISKNNRLEWIRDWARFHVREQGADAVLLYDNGSTDYALADLLRTFREVEGLEVAVVIQTALPYGPVGSDHTGKFLRPGLSNLARKRFLQDARAVLVCDVDELIVSRSDRTVFDATAQSWSGYILLPGVWRLPRLDLSRPPRHRDHVLARPEDPPCPRKFCIVPNGRMGRKYWRTHGLKGVFWKTRFQSKEFFFYHCQGISDFWKGPTSRPRTGHAAIDARTEAYFERVFS